MKPCKIACSMCVCVFDPSAMEDPLTGHIVMTSSTTFLPASSGVEEMDVRIWRKLPQSLVDRVLAFLPPPAFFRARSVCRRWYALLFSNTFLELRLRLAPRLDWFVFFEHHQPPVYVYSNSGGSSSSAGATSTSGNGRWGRERWGFLLDANEDIWYRIPFDAMIPPGLSFSPAASSGGLLCWVSEDPGLKTMVLCNPLSKLVGQLPVTSTPRLFPSVGLTVGPSSFIVQVAGDDLISPFAVKNLTSESFHADGTTGFYSPWATSCPLPRLCNLESGRMIYVDGRFYCMNYGPFSVLAYDASGNEWWKIQAPMRRFLRWPSLVECGGKVVLVAVVEKSKLSVPRSVRMWELQGCGRSWVEVERMPQQTYVEFAEVEGGRGFECMGSGGVVAVSVGGGEHVLLFDARRKAWRWAPQCPFLGMALGLRGYGFEPRLATPAIGLVDPSSISFQGFAG